MTTTNTSLNKSYLGFGVSLQPEHYDHILKYRPLIDWFEVLSDNYLIDGGPNLYYLYKIRENYPVAMHGISLSIGGTDPLNWTYLKKVKQLAERLETAWISDHLCWTGVNDHIVHQFLPLPYNENTLKHVIERVKQVQDFLGRQLLLENISSYVDYKCSAMSEWEFIARLTEESDCLLLLDVNNVYVSGYNQGFASEEYIQNIPVNRVKQFHLAGHDHQGSYIYDAHDREVVPSVWTLYEKAIRRFGQISTLIEWDNYIPDFERYSADMYKAKKIADVILKREAA